MGAGKWICEGHDGPDSITTKMSTTKLSMFAEKTEQNRQKMMADAKDKLAYLNTVRNLADTTPSSSIEAKNETLAFLDAKIRDLKIDADGRNRYSYNLHYAIDFGREANGVKPEFADAKFASSQDIVDFVNQLVLSDDMLYESDTYNIPSASEIDELLDGSRLRRIKFNINLDEDEDGPVPDFEVTRTRINY
jgi:hypothetical protein